MNALPSVGTSTPLGATIVDRGVNFSLFSRTATSLELVLFQKADDAKPSRVVRFDPAANRSYHYWHIFMPGLKAGQIYGFHVNGPHDPAKGLRFDPEQILLDP